MRRAWLTSSLGTCTAVLIAVGLIAAGPAFAADTTVTVAKDGDEGWTFNEDAGFVTPYEFTTDEASTGSGSLYVLPIGSNATDKFIAEQSTPRPAAEVESISFDFLIPATVTVPNAFQHFYLNLYVNLPTSPVDKFYDCRYNFVPSAGAIGQWNTATFSAAAPTSVTKSSTAPAGGQCPAKLEDIAEGSTIRMFSLNVGQSTASDMGIAGYLDNVVVASTSGSTAYDFEDLPVSKEECKNDGWMRFGIYRNQGECIAWLNSSKG